MVDVCVEDEDDVIDVDGIAVFEQLRFYIIGIGGIEPVRLKRSGRDQADGRSVGLCCDLHSPGGLRTSGCIPNEGMNFCWFAW